MWAWQSVKLGGAEVRGGYSREVLYLRIEEKFPHHPNVNSAMSQAASVFPLMFLRPNCISLNVPLSRLSRSRLLAMPLKAKIQNPNFSSQARKVPSIHVASCMSNAVS